MTVKMIVIVLQNSTLEQSTISIAIKLISPVASLISTACYWSLGKRRFFFLFVRWYRVKGPHLKGFPIVYLAKRIVGFDRNVYEGFSS